MTHLTYLLKRVSTYLMGPGLASATAVMVRSSPSITSSFLTGANTQMGPSGELTTLVRTPGGGGWEWAWGGTIVWAWVELGAWVEL